MFRVADEFFAPPRGPVRTGTPPLPVRHPLPRRLADRTLPLVSRPALLALLMLGVAIAARMVQFGNPVVQVDDQFYLLVGDRMLHGALPYVDIWDRKPVGLFLLYAGICSLGGDGVIAYQLVATTFAAATGFVVARIAGRFTTAHGAAAAGVIYILYLGVFGGEAGQSPVFYNLPVALAGWLVAGVIARPGFDRHSVALGVFATLLMGLSLQIKYTTAFEGAFFGLALMWKARREGLGISAVLGTACLWLGAALLPTALAWQSYAALGHGPAFVEANFLSIFRRSSDGTAIVLRRLVWILVAILPLAFAAALARQLQLDGHGGARGKATADFAYGWALAAVFGVVAFGTFFDHYALPLLAPLAIVAAPLFGSSGARLTIGAPGIAWRIPLSAVVMLLATALSVPTINTHRRDRGYGPQVRELAEFIAPRLQGSCLYIFQGDPALYRLTGSCLPTRWTFPNHLNQTREDGAVGVDALAETRRIMAARPRLVVALDDPDRDVNQRTWHFMRAELARAYRPIFAVRIGRRPQIVYEHIAGR